MCNQIQLLQIYVIIILLPTLTMKPKHAKSLIIALIALYSVSLILSSVVLAITIIFNYTGINMATDSVTLCSNYLILKFQTSNQARLSVSFISICFNLACIIALFCVSLIMFFQSLRMSSNEASVQKNLVKNWPKLIALYILTSCALMTTISVFGYFMSLIGERGKCTGVVQSDWIVIVVIMGVMLLSLISCIVILCFISNAIHKKAINIQSNEDSDAQSIQQTEEQSLKMEEEPAQALHLKNQQQQQQQQEENDFNKVELDYQPERQKKKFKIQKNQTPRMNRPPKLAKKKKKLFEQPQEDSRKESLLRADKYFKNKKMKDQMNNGGQSAKNQALLERNETALIECKRPARIPTTKTVMDEDYNYFDSKSIKVNKSSKKQKYHIESNMERMQRLIDQNQAKIQTHAQENLISGAESSLTPGAEPSSNQRQQTLVFQRKKPDISINKNRSRRMLFEEQAIILEGYNHESILGGLNEGNIPKEVDYDQQDDNRDARNDIRKKVKQLGVNSPKKIKKEKLAEWTLTQFIRSKYIQPDNERLFD